VHCSQQEHVLQASSRPGHVATQARWSKYSLFRRIGEIDDQYGLMQVAVLSYGLCASAKLFLKQLRVMAAERNHISQGNLCECLSRGELCAAWLRLMFLK
jgi:hypothetical protein